MRLDDIAFAAGLHLYALELRPDDTYEALVITRLSDVLVGAVPPAPTRTSGTTTTSIRTTGPATTRSSTRTASGPAASSSSPIGCCATTVRQFEVIERASSRTLPDGRVLLEGSVADVTQEREARARVAEVEERLQRLMEAVEEVVYTAEMDDEGQAHMVFVGPGAGRLIGGELTFEETWPTFRARTDPEDRAGARRGTSSASGRASRPRASTAPRPRRRAAVDLGARLSAAARGRAAARSSTAS